METQNFPIILFFFFRNNFAAGWMNLGTIKAALHKEGVNFSFDMASIIGSFSNQDHKGSRNCTTLTRKNGSFAFFTRRFSFLYISYPICYVNWPILQCCVDEHLMTHFLHQFKLIGCAHFAIQTLFSESRWLFSFKEGSPDLGGNRNAQRKPWKSDWARLSPSPHTLIVEVEGVINNHFTSQISTQNNRSMIAETRCSIFRCFSGNRYGQCLLV